MATKSRSQYYRDRREQLKNIPNRRCVHSGCTVKLSRYNYNECCWAHNFEYVKKNRIGLDKG